MSEPGDAAEIEADRVADRVSRGAPAGPMTAAAGAPVQRQPTASAPPAGTSSSVTLPPWIGQTFRGFSFPAPSFLETMCNDPANPASAGPLCRQFQSQPNPLAMPMLPPEFGMTQPEYKGLWLGLPVAPGLRAGPFGAIVPPPPGTTGGPMVNGWGGGGMLEWQF